MRDLIVIVGNGLSIDLCRNYYPGIETGNPLSRNYIIDQNPKIMARGAFPNVFQAWYKFRESNDGNQFDFFRHIRTSGSSNLNTEARHLLALCYSDISQRISSPPGWQWTKFFRENGHRIRMAASFNYDQVIEGLFSDIGIRYSQNSIENDCVTLFKPHGSCNMDCNPAFISLGPAQYPISNWLSNNDYPQCLVPTHHLMRPRTEAFCVLPHEENLYKTFQWQNGIWQSLRNNFGAVRHCLLIGHSYGDADQPEINEIISKLPDASNLHLCNPYPPESYELLTSIAHKKNISVHHHNGPPSAI